jgi:hypothetical protein
LQSFHSTIQKQNQNKPIETNSTTLNLDPFYSIIDSNLSIDEQFKKIHQHYQTKIELDEQSKCYKQKINHFMIIIFILFYFIFFYLYY